MSAIQNDDIQDIAVQAGTIVLENGGETFRAEETVVYVAKSLGATVSDSFVTPTVVILSWKNSDGRHFMNMKRITNRGTNLKKLALINSFSYDLVKNGKKETLEFIKENISKIENLKPYPKWSLILASALCSAFFALMFGGSFFDFCVAFAVGAFLRIMIVGLEAVHFNSFIVSIFSGFLISSATKLFCCIIPPADKGIVIIAVLMQVVPGLALTNSLRDFIAGDLIAGSARFFESLMIATGLAVGAAICYFVIG